MSCRDVEELIEAVAAGDLAPDDRFRAHVETCVACASALASARAIETALASRPVLAAPARFEASVAARIRHEHWRAEEQVDRVFNVAVAIGVLAIGVGALALFNLAGVTAAVTGAASSLAVAVAQPASAAEQPPPLWSYLIACALLGTSLLVWRWAESAKDSSR